MRPTEGGNFGARPKPPHARVEVGAVLGERGLQLLDAHRRAGGGARVLAQVPRQLGALVAQRGLVLAPQVGDADQQRAEAGPAVFVLGREVRAGEERLLVRGQEHGHRPAAVPLVHGQGGRHVDVVQVRALLAVDLHGDEVLVHEGGDVLVLERLALHHVAPVARRVADAEQDRLVLRARPRQRLLAPGMPVHRVVGVLQQVGAGAVGESVGVLRRRGHGHQHTRWTGPRGLADSGRHVAGRADADRRAARRSPPRPRRCLRVRDPAPAADPAAPLPAVETRLYLIGDAGAPAPGRPRPARRWPAQIAADPARSVVVFLGDNIYPAGPARPRALPGAGRRSGASTRRSTSCASAGARGVFVPGNHDWGAWGPDGLGGREAAGRAHRRAWRRRTRRCSPPTDARAPWCATSTRGSA